MQIHLLTTANSEKVFFQLDGFGHMSHRTPRGRLHFFPSLGNPWMEKSVTFCIFHTTAGGK